MQSRRMFWTATGIDDIKFERILIDLAFISNRGVLDRRNKVMLILNLFLKGGDFGPPLRFFKNI